MKKIFSIIIIISIFLFIEFISFVGSKLNLFIFNEHPYIYSKNPSEIISNYWTEKEIWGAWHTKNFKVKHKKKCFDVLYETNEIGARDTTFQNLTNSNNIVLLGDSFAEGYGVNKKNTFENIIENNINTEVLNFATSKDFGFIQYLLIYENLAKKYKHENILISFLVNNDFKDNDYNYYKKNKLDFIKGKSRHRPYYIFKDDKFEIKFPQKKTNTDENIFELTKKYFWFSNVLRSIKYLIVSHNIKKKEKKLMNNYSINNQNEFGNTVYYYTPKLQQRAIVYFLEKFIKDNKNKKIILFTIPLYGDYLEIKKNDKRNNIFWWKRFNDLSKNNNNFYFLDLYDYSSDKLKSKFFSEKCDGHWNAEGHKWAGELLSKYLLDNLNYQ